MTGPKAQIPNPKAFRAAHNRRMHPQPLAYLDQEFLESEEARPMRILAEYLEPARRFRLENIQDTVVFFGSARVHSRERASSGSRKRRMWVR